VFLHPLGLLALAAVPAVVALHLYRRRYEPRTVSALFLWSTEDRTEAAGRKREPLRRSRSFWFEVLAALALALVFAGPRPLVMREARHLVLVLDSSASLGARDSRGSLRDEALAIARERIRSLPRDSRVTLLVSSVRPELLAGPAALPMEALEALETFEPGRAHHDLGATLSLALELSGSRAVTLITDTIDVGAVPPEVEIVALGRPAPNAGIVAVSRRRDTGGSALASALDGSTPEGTSSTAAERVSLTLASFAERAIERTLRLETEDGAVFATRAVRLEPRAETHLSFDLPDGAPPLIARLVAPASAAGSAATTPSNPSAHLDALAADDIAWLAPAPRRMLRLASTLPAALGAALGVDTPARPSNIDRWLDLVPEAIDAINPAVAHLVLSAALPLPSEASAAWTLAIAAPGEERTHFIGPFLTDPTHPLLQGVTLEGIVWSAAANVTLVGAPFVSAGDQPIATEIREGARVAWLLNLDAARSSLHRSPDWPILLANAAEARRAALPGAAATTLALGEPLRYRVERPTTLRWTKASGEAGTPREMRVADLLTLDDIDLPALYELAELDASGNPTSSTHVGVSLCDRSESDLSTRSSGVRAAIADEATVRAGFSWIEVALLTLALACIALDWWALAPGSTASSPRASRTASRAGGRA